MKAEKEAQEILTRRRAEEAQRQQMLQRIGSGTPGQPHVSCSSYILSMLIGTILPRRKLRLPKRSRLRGRPRHSPLRTITEQGLS